MAREQLHNPQSNMAYQSAQLVEMIESSRNHLNDNAALATKVANTLHDWLEG